MNLLRFKDVTFDYPDIVSTCSNNGNGPETVIVYMNMRILELFTVSTTKVNTSVFLIRIGI